MSTKSKQFLLHDPRTRPGWEKRPLSSQIALVREHEREVRKMKLREARRVAALRLRRARYARVKADPTYQAARDEQNARSMAQRLSRTA